MAVSAAIGLIGKIMEDVIADLGALLEGDQGHILQYAKGCDLSHHPGLALDLEVTLLGIGGITAVASRQGMFMK